MSNEQELKDVGDEPKEETKVTDELASEELDQVVGGNAGSSQLHGPSPEIRAGILIEDRVQRE